VENKRVKVWTKKVSIPTYLPAPPDKNPMFLEKRVYQGSSGRVYPLPFTDRISETKTERRWQAVYLENQYLQVMILPEIGGRVHAVLDKTNGYDLIYRQEVIKPALVGLAGSWISGGIEFNWAQHHRPATFMPVDFETEEQPDGSITVWLGDHEPIGDEDPVGVPAHVAEEPVDREQPAPERRERPDEEGALPARWEISEQHLGHALVEHGPEHRREQEQEREAGRAVAIEAQQAARRDRDPRPRDAGREGERLREPEGNRMRGSKLPHRPVLG
jgi:hypothetical protein